MSPTAVVHFVIDFLVLFILVRFIVVVLFGAPRGLAVCSCCRSLE